MKKLLSLLSLSLCLYASAPTEDPYSLGLICTDQQAQAAFAHDEYVSDSSNLVVGITPSSKSYNPKTGRYRVWAVFMPKQGASEPVGYFRIYKEFDVKSKQVRMLQYAQYACNGVVVQSDTVPNDPFDAVIPNSLDAAVMQTYK